MITFNNFSEENLYYTRYLKHFYHTKKSFIKIDKGLF